MLDVDAKLWDFYTNFFWATALLTSALWYDRSSPHSSIIHSNSSRNAYVVLQYIVQQSYSIERKEEE